MKNLERLIREEAGPGTTLVWGTVQADGRVLLDRDAVSGIALPASLPKLMPLNEGDRTAVLMYGRAKPGQGQSMLAIGTLSGSTLPEPPAWTAPTLNASWSAMAGAWAPYQTIRHRLYGGVVEIEGGARFTGTATSVLMFTLPVGFRPSATVEFVVRPSTGTGYVIVIPTGEVYLVLSSSLTNFNVSLSGIRFGV